MRNENRENIETCRRIADELYNLATGKAIWANGDSHEIEEDDAGRQYVEIDGEIWTEDPDENNPEEKDIEDLDNRGIYGYFDDVLDIEYIIAADGSYKGTRILITCGGPNIWIDTRAGEVQLFWWTDRASWDLDRETIEAIDDIFCEYYNATR